VPTDDGFEVRLDGPQGAFVRRAATSQGDARNQAEFLRVLLERSRAGLQRLPARQPLVLLIEDDPDNLFAYEETLRVYGFRTASACSLAEARRLLEQVRPSAILLDHLLPDGEGGSRCGELRDMTNYSLPIVLVTGVDPERVVLGPQGPDAVLAKPCRPETLIAVLKLLIPRRKSVVTDGIYAES
jgi:CheY-like chemotaxis protein